MPDAAPLLLAIDTSTETAGLCLYDGERISEITWEAGRNQTSTLLAQVDHLLRLNGLEARALGAVAVAVGPGTFNGLRVGMSVAKGFSFGLGISIVGVSTLDVVAYPHAASRRPIRAFVNAGRGRVVYADYRHRNGRWVRQTDLRNERLECIATGLVEKTIIAGQVTAALAASLAENPMVILPSPALRLRRPSYLAELAHRRWQSGDVDRVETMEPVYVHGAPPGGVAEEPEAADRP